MCKPAIDPWLLDVIRDVAAKVDAKEWVTEIVSPLDELFDLAFELFRCVALSGGAITLAVTE